MDPRTLIGLPSFIAGLNLMARPQYHKARLGTRSSGGAHSFAVASAARAVTVDSLRRV